MNDRELLELAAMSAGYVLLFCPTSRVDGFYCVEESDGGPLKGWNPLTDDGDALRLAVKLRLEIMFFEGFQEVHSSHYSSIHTECSKEYGEDIMASTRRVIVRAAAEIGKKVKEGCYEF